MVSYRSQIPEEFQEILREEKRRARRHALAVVEACKTGDAERFYHLVYPYDDHPRFWTTAMRMIARSLTHVSTEIQTAFRSAWIETKMISLQNGGLRAFCQALKVLMPPYQGPAVKLFRGASAIERTRRVYGLS